MIIFHLITEFFKIGLFSVGGGYATIPFLYQLVNDYDWYTAKELSNMIAVSILTPGPVGVNMATFAGFKTLGIIGGIITTISLVLPSYILIILISKALKKYHDNGYIKSILNTLKPAGCGLLLSVLVKFLKTNINSKESFLLFLFLFFLSFKFKKNPVFYFLISSIIAVSLYYLNLI